MNSKEMVLRVGEEIVSVRLLDGQVICLASVALPEEVIPGEEIAKIQEYQENSPYGPVPWLAVYTGARVLSKYNGSHVVAIHYTA